MSTCGASTTPTNRSAASGPSSGPARSPSAGCEARRDELLGMARRVAGSADPGGRRRDIHGGLGGALRAGRRFGSP